MITIDKLQLYRNGVYFESKELALQALEKEKANAKDGEIMLARYYASSPYNMPSTLEVYTIIAVFATNEDGVSMTICDPSDLNDKLNGVVVNNIGGTYTNNNGYLEYSVILAAKDIETSQDYTVVNHEVIGDTSFDSILVGDSIEVAFNKLESNFDKLVNEIIDNELVIAKAITTLNESLGMGGDGTYPEVVSGPLAGAINLFEADTLLANEIDVVKERVDALESIPPLQSSNTILVTQVKDSENNVIARQLEINQELNIIVESDYELD